MSDAKPVHPRACGEHGRECLQRKTQSGSSPRVRGTCRRSSFRQHRTRFIPARAGNIGFGDNLRGANPVHPRACGEHSERPSARPGRRGSSPRVRGTSFAQPGERDNTRFIPARAGNMPCAQNSDWRWTVHPRACGEHARFFMMSAKSFGSSPRVRGTFVVQVPDLDCYRFIPARAGNIARRSVGATTGPVHPRACGEHRNTHSVLRGLGGSSPRVRGTFPLRCVSRT